jgi:vitamin B12 transporter
VTAAITVLDGATLRAQGLRHVADALRTVPGLAVVQSGSFGGNTAVFVRGGESNFVKVLVDGVAANQPGGAVDLAHLTLDNVERIEILRGPASVLYGSDAVSGVIQILTRRGAGAARAEVGVRGGRYGTFAADAGLSGGTDAVSYGFALARSTTDGILAFNNRYDNTTWSGSVRAAPDTRTEVVLSVRYADGEFHLPTDGAGRLVDRNAFNRQRQLVGGLEVAHRFADPLEGRLVVSLSELDAGFDDGPDGPADTLGFYGFHSVQTAFRRGLDGRVNVRPLPDVVVTAGAQLEDQGERTVSESLSEFGATASAQDAGRLNRAYYAQLHATPGGMLAVTVGVRVDDNQRFGTFVTYRGGVSYELPSATRVRASLGRGFREPTFLENTSADPSFRGNPALEPERSTSWEVGIEQLAAGGRLRAAAAYFRQEFHDLIQFTFAPPDPAGPHFFNVAAAEASGLELELELHPGPGFTLGGAYTALATRVADPGFDAEAGAEFVRDSTLLRRPSGTLSVHAAYRVVDRATVAASLRRVGERADRDFSSFPFRRVALAPYVDLAVSAEIDVLRAGGRVVAASGRLENVLDERYQEIFGFAAPRRRLAVGVRARF